MTSTNFQAPGPHFSMDASMTFRNSLSLSAATWVWNLEWTHGVPGKNRSKARANWKILEDSFTPLSNLVSAVCVVNCVYIKIFTYIQYVSYLFESFHILTNIALSLSLSPSPNIIHLWGTDLGYWTHAIMSQTYHLSTVKKKHTFRLTKTSSRETPALLIPARQKGWLLWGKRETKPPRPKVPLIFPNQIHSNK